MWINAVSGSARGMHIMYNFIKGVNHVFVNRISSKSDAEIVISASHKLYHRVLALIVDIVCAQINVLELNILEKDKALYFLPISISVGSVLNHV